MIQFILLKIPLEMLNGIVNAGFLTFTEVLRKSEPEWYTSKVFDMRQVLDPLIFIYT